MASSRWPRWSLSNHNNRSLLGENPGVHTAAYVVVFLSLLGFGILIAVVPTGKNLAYGPHASATGSVFYDPGPTPVMVQYIDSTTGRQVAVQQSVSVPLYDGAGQPLYVPQRYPNNTVMFAGGVQLNQTDANGNMIPVTVEELLVTASTPTLLPQYAGYGPTYFGIDSGDTAWVLTSSGLVLIMTPGVAFFYGGLVRPKNVVSTISQSFICMCIVTVVWTTVGFSLAFGPDLGAAGILGDPRAYYFYNNVGSLPIPFMLNANQAYPSTVPWAAWSMFQLMFAIVTSAIITGSFAERVRFGSVCIFTTLWHLVVYCPIAHIVWSPNGLLKWWGSLDFAGGTVVHMSSGLASLVGAWYIGQRGHGISDVWVPSSVPHVMLGTALMWFGWLGFNAGSAGAAGALAAQAWVVTNAAAASSMGAWVLLTCMYGYKVSGLSACFGAIIGLIVITPGAGYVNVGAAIVEGVVGATACFHVQNFVMPRTRIDDGLDSFTIHGVGGFVGFLLTACFACPDVNPVYDNGGNLMVGLFYGGVGADCLMLKQLAAVAGLVPCVLLLSYICFKVTDLIYPLRVLPEDELQGLDVSCHDNDMAIFEAFGLSAGNGPTNVSTGTNASGGAIGLFGGLTGRVGGTGGGTGAGSTGGDRRDNSSAPANSSSIGIELHNTLTKGQSDSQFPLIHHHQLPSPLVSPQHNSSSGILHGGRSGLPSRSDATKWTSLRGNPLDDSVHRSISCTSLDGLIATPAGLRSQRRSMPLQDGYGTPGGSAKGPGNLGGGGAGTSIPSIMSNGSPTRTQSGGGVLGGGTKRTGASEAGAGCTAASLTTVSGTSAAQQLAGQIARRLATKRSSNLSMPLAEVMAAPSSPEVGTAGGGGGTSGSSGSSADKRRHSAAVTSQNMLAARVGLEPRFSVK